MQNWQNKREQIRRADMDCQTDWPWGRQVSGEDRHRLGEKED